MPEPLNPQVIELVDAVVLRVRPGDAIVLTPHRAITAVEADTLKSRWGALFAGTPIGEVPVIVIAGADLSVVRVEES